MKIAALIAKILAAAAFVAGAVYLIATYGDKIVAWAKKLLKCNCCEEEVIEGETEEAAEEATEEVEEAAEEDVVEVTEEVAEEATEETPVAEETDFVG